MDELGSLFAERTQLDDRVDRIAVRVGFGEARQSGGFRPFYWEKLEVDRLHRLVVAGPAKIKSPSRRQ
jgi:hypothetical protein